MSDGSDASAPRNDGRRESSWRGGQLSTDGEAAPLGLLGLAGAGRTTLLEAGFASSSEVASEPFASFARKVGAALGPAETARVHALANVHTALLDDISTARRVDPRGATVSQVARSLAAAGHDPSACGCPDCEAASSPAAYLADLLSYANARLSWQGDASQAAEPATPTLISLLLNQPIADLPTDCGAVEMEVPQIRLCIESLRALIARNLVASPDAACSPFRHRVAFAFSADVDGDGQDELIVGFDPDPRSLIGPRHAVGTGVWAMRFDRPSGRWQHLAPGSDPTAATFYLPPGHTVKLAFAAKVQVATSSAGHDRQQLVLAVADPGTVGLPIWVLELDPATLEWSHITPGPQRSAVAPGGIFEPGVLDLAVAPGDARVAGGFAADIDGDALDELVFWGTTATEQSVFWVFEPSGLAWRRVGPAGATSDEAFVCDPASGGTTYPIKLATAGDVDRDGRVEIIAFPDAPGAYGKNPWIVKWDGASWQHLRPSSGLPLHADAELGAAPWPAAHAFVADATGTNSAELVVAPELVSGAVPSDANRFAVYRYRTPTPFDASNFETLTSADCSPSRDSAQLAIAADVDGDTRDELVVLTAHADGNAAWVMDRTSAGAWQHLSPMAGHPLGADLEWTAGGAHRAERAFAADVDGDGQDEVVFVGDGCTQLWVMKYRQASGRWEHVRASGAPALRYEGAAYRALLVQLGTSYDEVRLARSGDDVTRRALADRLAIDAGSRSAPAGDRLDQLVCDPASVSEERIEELFGLVSTTRNPLANVAVVGDARGQTRDWHLDGIDWAGDLLASATDAEGRIYASLQLVGTKVTLELFADAARQRAIASGEGARSGTVQLSPLDGSGVSGRVTIAYQADASDIVLTALPQVAVWRATHLRAEWDAQDWQADAFSASGAGATASTELLPMVDPDLVGPDDLRLPLAKVDVSAPDGAFDLWLRRRAWVDGLLEDLRARQPDVGSMFDYLRPAAGAPSPADYAWHDAPPSKDFDALAAALSSGDARSVEQARTTVRSRLRLSVDAFLRLVDLAARGIAATPPLTDVEWGELRSILAQACKDARFDEWRSEEHKASIGLNGESFATVAVSPGEGAWPPWSTPATPLLDPELVAPTELPISRAGVEARELLRRRSGELRASTASLRAQRPLGLEAVLVAGFGPAPAPGDWVAWVNTRAERLQSSDPSVVGPAEADVRTALPGASSTLFRRMAAVTARPAGSVLSDSHWADVEVCAAAVRKQRLLYPAWSTAETTAGRIPYWKARRAVLPRWRASLADRVRWEEALRARTRTPVLDPDHIPATYLRSKRGRAYELYFGRLGSTKPGRLRELRLKEDALRALLAGATTTLLGLDAAIVDVLTPGADTGRVRADVAARRLAGGLDLLLGEVFGDQVDELQPLLLALDGGGAPAVLAEKAVLQGLCFGSAAAFRAVMEARANPTKPSPAEWQSIESTLAGTATVRWLVHADRRATETARKLAAVLEQLGFSTSAWRRLRATRSLAALGTPPLLPEEVDEAIAILMRADKVRRYGRWRQEERGTSPEVPVRLGPDAFRLPAPSPSAAALPELSAWRVLPAEARQWRDGLTARTAQHRGVFVALRTSVERVEEGVLPILRDQLIASLPVPDGSIGAAMRWASNFLVTDCQVGSCRRTTRVSHAIDSVLALLWSVRTGQLSDTYPALRLDDRTFDADWRWIGSYATWRSAILVHLHPENLLLPSLKRRPTPAFRALLQGLRTGSRLTASGAGRLADAYSQYLRDVCSLQIGGCVEAATRHFPERADHPEGMTHTVAFLFALASSGAAYWCVRDAHANDVEFAQSYWEPLPGFSGPVTELIGATVQLPTTGTRPTTAHPKVFVFAKVAGDSGEALELLRYDLESGTWDGEAVPLELPGEPSSFTVALLSTAMTAPPMLEIRARKRDAAGKDEDALYVGSLGLAGNGWDRDSPRASSVVGAWNPLGLDISVDHPALAGIREIVAGDFDNDGRDELLVRDSVKGGDATKENDYWLLDYANGHWSAQRNLDCSSDAVAARYTLVGDVDGDGRDEVIVAAADPTRFWVMRYDGSSWGHVSTTPADGRYDLSCSSWEDDIPGDKQFYVPCEFAVCGHFFDGDSKDSVAMAIAPGTHPQGNIAETIYTGFWVFKIEGGAWKRLGDVTMLRAAFRCCTDDSQKEKAAFAVTGDFDGDGRDEIAVAASSFVGDPASGNHFWVMDFRGGSWQPLGAPRAARETVFDLGSAAPPAAFAVAGDFDGDGREEILVAPFVPPASGQSQLWVAELVPGLDPADPTWGATWKTSQPAALRLPYVAAHAVVGDFDGDGRDEVAIIPFIGGAIEIADYLPETDEWQILPAGLGKLTLPGTTAFAVAGRFQGGAEGKQGVAVVPGVHGAVAQRYSASAPGATLVSARLFVETQPLPECVCLDFKPEFAGPFDIRRRGDSKARRAVVLEALDRNANKPLSQQAWLHEAFYSVPLQIAVALQQAHDYEAALDWFRLVYDYGRPHAERNVYSGLDEVAADGPSYERDLLQWLQDPLDPHAIAAARPGTYLRGTLLLLIRCFLDYADAEFTQDTSEAIERARILYGTALELLRLPELDQSLGVCADLIARIPAAGTGPALLQAPSSVAPGMATVVERAQGRGAASHIELMRDEKVVRAVAALGGSARNFAALPVGLSMRYPLNNKHGFCVGPNPMLEALRLHAEVSLFKIRTCRNIAGMRRSLELYASPTDQSAGLPMIGLDGQLSAPPSGALTATPYRYSALILRAKELVAHAQQMEGLMLSALEKRDAEALTLLRARQEIQVARAVVRIHDLQIGQAQDRVALAELQKERAAIEGDHYRELLDAGELELEREALGWLEQSLRYTYTAAAFESAAAFNQALAASGYTYSAVVSVLPAAIAGAAAAAAAATAAAASSTASSFHSLSQASSTWSQMQQMRATRERTMQDWQLRVALSLQDQRVGDQQIRIETDQVRISQQELAVSELQAGNAERLLDFHMQKFTSLELFEWMSTILERSYSFLLQQATAMAQLAARQLAFERQEPMTPGIQADYWEPAAQGSESGEGGARGRRGLTGSARLLEDILRLDQWAFDTNRRKLQLSKTFSLAQLVPLELEQLRTTGMMTFNAPTQLFDGEFPGHYLRLIKRVSVSVVALVPPAQGIRASLSSSGVSRVVVGPEPFQTTLIHRLPESIALTSPIGSTGVFAFESQSELANPFESQGVDTTWELRMPKPANAFDYSTLADVMVTIDYTALDSFDYGQQVIAQLDRRFTGDRAFSLRRDFADAWWDLHNPDQVGTPFLVHFEIGRGDFPPNLESLQIADVTLLFVSDSPVPAEAAPVTLTFTERGATAGVGGAATPVERLVSTRRANGGTWRAMIGKVPSGRWELRLVDSPESRDWLAGSDVIDILVVVSYVAITPAWPTQER